MATRLESATCKAPVETLVVFLPGAYSDPKEFEEEGFVQALRERNIAADALLVDARLGYYTQRTIIERLEADVFAPAKARGYRAIWLVGISVGGLGAIIHEDQAPGQVAGIVAIAPYLGERAQSLDIANAGGLAEWNKPLGPQTRVSDDERLWTWLKGYADPAVTPGRPPLYLGYGREDRFAFSHRLLAAVLPPPRVFTTEGGHEWPAWRRLWLQMLDVLPLPVCG